jgi:hypothetical protein
MIGTTKFIKLNVLKAVTLKTFIPRLILFKKKVHRYYKKATFWVDAGQMS